MTTYEIIHNPHPTTNELRHLLNVDPRVKAIPAYKKALELKLQSLIQEPTTIEKTMTPAQLFAVDSPLWALNFAGEDIDKLLKRLKDQPNTEEAFNIALRTIQNPMLIMNEFGNLRSLGGVHGNRLQVGRSQKHKYQKIKQ